MGIKLQLHWQILIAIVAAGFAGWLSGTEAGIFGIPFLAVYEFVGTLFLNALKMIIVPLITASIIAGIASLVEGGRLVRQSGVLPERAYLMVGSAFTILASSV